MPGTPARQASAAGYPRGVSERPRVKPVEQADRQGARLAEAGEAASREWWRRVPRIVTAPRPVFAALAETDDVDVDARAEPVLALTILGGMAAMLLAPGWNVMDDWTVDWLVVAVVTFIGALFYGAAGYFLLGLALWLGAKAVGVEAPFKIARQVVAFAALPLVLSLVVVLPTILIGYGEDWFRSGGADDAGDGRTIVTAIGLAFVAWSLVLVGIGLRTTFRLPWRGVVGALLLAGVLVAAFAVLPTAL